MTKKNDHLIIEHVLSLLRTAFEDQFCLCYSAYSSDLQKRSCCKMKKEKLSIEFDVSSQCSLA